MLKKAKVKVDTVEHEPKLALISGSEQGIYPFILSLTLSRTGSSVLVIDNSVRQDLFSSIPVKDGVGTIDGIPVLSARRYTPEIMKQFDYTIVYTGYSDPDSEYLENADVMFLLSDYTLYSQAYMEKIHIPEGLGARIIFGPKPNNKSRENLIISKMKGYDAAQGLDYYVLYIDERDLAGYLEMQNTGYVSPKAMSKAFMKIISDMTADIDNAQQGQVPSHKEEEE